MTTTTAQPNAHSAADDEGMLWSLRGADPGILRSAAVLKLDLRP